jgi:hypothetical protein
MTLEQYKFRGSEVATQVAAAMEAIPEGREIVTMSAGENMIVRLALAPQEISVTDEIIEYAWTGDGFVEIGVL